MNNPIAVITACLALTGCSPIEDIANTFWENEPAPWEDVDAFYYPDKNDLASSESQPGLKTLDECRIWVQGRASENHDSALSRGDYECGVGFMEMFGDVKIYRTTAK